MGDDVEGHVCVGVWWGAGAWEEPRRGGGALAPRKGAESAAAVCVRPRHAPLWHAGEPAGSAAGEGGGACMTGVPQTRGLGGGRAWGAAQKGHGAKKEHAPERAREASLQRVRVVL